MKDTDRSQDVLGPMMAIDRYNEAAMPHFTCISNSTRDAHSQASQVSISINQQDIINRYYCWHRHHVIPIGHRHRYFVDARRCNITGTGTIATN